MKNDDKLTGLALMRSPFPDHQVSILCRSTKKDNPKGKCSKCGGYHGLPAIPLSYVGHAALTDRLLDCDPAWSWEPLAVGQDGYPVLDESGGMWIKLTVCGVTRLGYGDAQGKTGGDAMKERIGDALRNAAMRFGAALELWHKGDLHIDEDNKEEELARIESLKQTYLKEADKGTESFRAFFNDQKKEDRNAVWSLYEKSLKDAMSNADKTLKRAA